MGAAFEVNRQMCDIEKDLSEAGYFRKICEGQIEARKKLIDMEKKKMTKAEAFEYLKGKKVKCYLGYNYVGKLLLTKIIECGFKSEITVPEGNEPFSWAFFMLRNGETMMLDLAVADTYRTYEYGEINAEELLSIEIVEGTPKFSYEKVVELAKPLMEYLNDTGCSEQIGVSYDHIVAQPMATFLHGEMKGC